mmetsp:Transcript_12248/g.17086  ORF Transcript_12248/g.17086 Transcript_12248/m.17086 type:complete len:190 (-) Transcript_12248:285-854(-)
MADAHRSFDGLTSLITFTGFAIPARARFVAQFLGSTVYTSITFGLVAGQAGAMLSCGPLIPFMAGSWFGYTYGCVGFWKLTKSKALSYARNYPKVVAHSLQTNFDMEVPKHVAMESSIKEEEDDKQLKAKVPAPGQSLEQWISKGGIKRLSYAILAAQGCEEEIVEMQKKQKQKLVDEYFDEDRSATVI